MLDFDVTPRRALLYSFALAFFVRLIPELLAYPYPIGYDTVIYAWIVKRGVIWGHWTYVFSNWLLYGVWISIYNVTQVDLFLLLKLSGPVLFGLSAVGVYWFSSRGLKWSPRRSLLVAGLFVFQLAAFRLSWDLLRNTLGMALLFFALPFLLKMESWKDVAGFVLLSVLVVFAHDLVSVVMFVVVFGLLLRDFLRRNMARLLRVSAAVFPSLAIFLMGIFLKVFSLQVGIKTNIITAIQPVDHPGGLFFIANYFVSSNSGYYSGYFDLASQVLSVFTILYLLIIPLVFVGFFRNRVLDTWTLFTVVAAFSPLMLPFFALNWWQRYLFLLVIPFTFYVANGVFKVLESKDAVRPNLKWLRWMKVSKWTIAVLLSGMVLLTSIYIGATLQNDNYVVFSIPTISRYFSVAPAVPLRDVEGTIEVMEWLDGKMNSSSCVLANFAFVSWALLYLDKNQTIVAFMNNAEEALDLALSSGFNWVYLVWWGEDIGWYWFTVPPGFEAVFESGRMAAFQYLG